MTVHEFEINKGEAAKRLVPDIQFKVSDVGGDNETIEFLDPSQTPPTDAEIEAEIALMWEEFPWTGIRRQRDALLRASDWTDLPSCQLDNVADWQTHRQTLRDIPQTYDDADDVVWPESPEE